MATIASLSVLVDADTRRFNRGIKGVQQDIQRTERMGSRLAGNWKMLAIRATGVAVAVGGITVALGKFAQAGSRSLNLQAAFIGRVEDSEAALQQLRSATRGLVTDTELMTQTNMALTLGSADTVEQFAEMAAGAQKLGRALGLDTAFALNSLNIGIARQSRLVLDNLGLIVSAEQANREYAAAIGVAVDQLTDAQKQEAFRAEALDQLREKTESLGTATRNAGDAYGELIVTLTNGKDSLSQWVSESGALIWIFDTLETKARLIKSSFESAFGGSSSTASLNRQLLQAAAAERERAAADAQAAIAAREAAQANAELAHQVQFLMGLMNEAQEPLNPLVAQLGEVTAANYRLVPSFDLLENGLIASGDSVNRLTGGLRGAAAAQRDMNDAMRDAQGFLGAIGSIGSVFGGIPFIGQATSLLSGFAGLGGLFGGGGGGAKAAKVKKFGGFKASGGPVQAGTSYMVGEQGPEMFTPSQSGTITPNSGGSVVINMAPASSKMERMFQDWLYESIRQMEHNGVRVNFA